MKKLLTTLFILVSLAGCGPSCDEQGGTLVQTGVIMIPTVVGSVTIFSQYPQYECRMAEMETK